jgi:phosphoribosylformimino-5-aminoimidazole carboxamide ribotide isomerase
VIAIPAIDLRDGACVQLVGGSYEEERIRIADPLAVAARWTADGFRRLHVVDLDAATGAGDNSLLVRCMLQARTGVMQVGGGIRSTERIDALLGQGADVLVVGTRAIEDREWLAAESRRNPRRIIVAADVREGRVAVNGWARKTTLDAIDVVKELRALPLAAFLLTAVDVEGTMRGPDLGLVSAAAGATSVPVIASGGIGTIDHLRSLAAHGASAAVIGMALYTGALDPKAVAEEFDS